MRALTVKAQPTLIEHETADSLAAVAEALATRIPSIKKQMPDVVKALHDILDGMNTESIETRTKLQMHLVQVSSGLVLEKNQSDEMLSTEQAAAMMKCSRPYVAMLVDRKRLAGAVKTTGGHRKIPLSSVRAWMKENLPHRDADADYKRAARDAGMYEIPEETYVKVSSRTRKGSARA